MRILNEEHENFSYNIPDKNILSTQYDITNNEQEACNIQISFESSTQENNLNIISERKCGNTNNPQELENKNCDSLLSGKYLCTSNNIDGVLIEKTESSYKFVNIPKKCETNTKTESNNFDVKSHDVAYNRNNFNDFNKNEDTDDLFKKLDICQSEQQETDYDEEQELNKKISELEMRKKENSKRLVARGPRKYNTSGGFIYQDNSKLNLAHSSHIIKKTEKLPILESEEIDRYFRNIETHDTYKQRICCNCTHIDSNILHGGICKCRDDKSTNKINDFRQISSYVTTNSVGREQIFCINNLSGPNPNSRGPNIDNISYICASQNCHKNVVQNFGTNLSKPVNCINNISIHQLNSGRETDRQIPQHEKREIRNNIVRNIISKEDSRTSLGSSNVGTINEINKRSAKTSRPSVDSFDSGYERSPQDHSSTSEGSRDTDSENHENTNFVFENKLDKSNIKKDGFAIKKGHPFKDKLKSTIEDEVMVHYWVNFNLIGHDKLSSLNCDGDTHLLLLLQDYKLRTHFNADFYCLCEILLKEKLGKVLEAKNNNGKCALDFIEDLPVGENFNLIKNYFQEVLERLCN